MAKIGDPPQPDLEAAVTAAVSEMISAAFQVRGHQASVDLFADAQANLTKALREFRNQTAPRY